MLVDADKMSEDAHRILHNHNAQTERGRATLEHKIGISDIGGCREYVRFMTVQEPFTDDPENWAAFVGEAVDGLTKVAFQKELGGLKADVSVWVELPSGFSYIGHPDLVLPGGQKWADGAHGVVDIKTVDGLEAIKRNGPDEQQEIQRHLYYAACRQAGLIKDDDGIVANMWLDRSGRDPKPYVQVESYDPTWLTVADEWISDVVYAVKTGEHAMKDKPLEWCQVCCPFFSACRGADILKDRESQGLIEDPFLLDLVEMYDEAREDKKNADRRLEDARRGLAHVSGTTGQHVVKWIFVDASDVPGYTRKPYYKLDVRKMPKPQRK